MKTGGYCIKKLLSFKYHSTKKILICTYRGGATGVGDKGGGRLPPMVFRKKGKIRRLWVLSCVGVIKISISFIFNKEKHGLRAEGFYYE